MRDGSIVLSATLLALLLAPATRADTIHCDGEFGEVELDGNLAIAQPCVLRGTEVDGNVRLFEGGSLVAVDAEIDGNLEGKSADYVEIQNSRIDGNLKLDELVGDDSRISDSTIDGNVSLKKNRSRIELQRNYVDSNVDVRDNRGELTITDNVIDGNLKCDKNDPAPIVRNNSVSGKKEKQCKDSQPASSPTGSNDDAGEDNGQDNNQDDNADGDDGQIDDAAVDNSQDDDSIGIDDSVSNDGGNDVVSNEPPFELNTGTGGGASLDPILAAILLALILFRRISERRQMRPRHGWQKRG